MGVCMRKCSRDCKRECIDARGLPKNDAAAAQENVIGCKVRWRT